jgi:hypothetical protein
MKIVIYRESQIGTIPIQSILNRETLLRLVRWHTIADSLVDSANIVG